eukprot:6863878-Pyramimonas_sp.AAC.1
MWLKFVAGGSEDLGLWRGEAAAPSGVHLMLGTERRILSASLCSYDYFAAAGVGDVSNFSPSACR